MNKLHKAALWYADHDFSVIPVRPDKKPYIRWTKWQKERADPDQINAWWVKWPEANVGLIAGKISGFMAVDCDSQAGIDAVNKFLPDQLVLPVCRTPGLGQHFYFKYRSGLSNGVRVLTDTDLKLRSAGQNAPAMALVERAFIRLAMLGSR